MIRAHARTHSVGIFWKSEKSVAESFTWQLTTHKRDRHSCLRWDSNPQSQQPIGRRPTP